MPLNMQHEATVKNVTGKQTQGFLRASCRKAPGTRIGLMTDWREGSTKSGKLSGRYGRSLRDGK
jgi:hypothetical protein